MHAVAAPTLDELLARHFGFPGFQPGQRDPIETVLGGGDAVVVMPTGAGKSLCFQLPALALPGITLVVSPLISLMKDQVDRLVERGLPATCLNSSVSLEETVTRVAALRRGETRLVYVAPERFRNARFRDLLKELRVSLLAIDEAHCISQWGHDFRPDYLRLGGVLKEFTGTPVLALTATATPEVREDIIRQLGLGEQGRRPPRVFVRGFRRPNLRMVVEPCASHRDKLQRIRAILAEFPTGIVYCSTRKQVERVGELLGAMQVRHMIYHAGLGDDARTRAQERFMNGEVPVVVATNAFGMGVDRSDLRFVVHWDIPGSIEAYYQEVGRAGRDGLASHCELLYNYADVSTQQFFLDGSNPEPALVLRLWTEVRAVLAKGPRTCPLDDWADQVAATDNTITVHTCMGLFERAGLIRRAIGSGNRCYTTMLAPDGDLARLKDLLPTIEEKRRRDLRKLDLMVSYVHARQCRHRFILDYFGEAGDRKAGACGQCDYCGVSAVLPPRPPTEAEWPIVQKLLSGVGRLEGRFGRQTVLAVATGAPSKTVAQHGLDTLSTHGLLKGEPESYLGSVFDELVRAGAIALGPPPHPVARLTALGREVAWRRSTVALQWPARAVGPTPAIVGDGRARKAAPKARKGKPAKAAGEERQVLSAAEERVFEALKAWRRDEAARTGAPGFVIFGNRALKAIALARPDSLRALEAVPGVGPAKLEAYGDTVLEVVDRYR
jgi:ATP-dependent DNA helicase RecQ